LKEARNADNLDRLIGGAERDPTATARKAGRMPGPPLRLPCARGSGQHHLRAPTLLECLGDIVVALSI